MWVEFVSSLLFTQCETNNEVYAGLDADCNNVICSPPNYNSLRHFINIAWFFCRGIVRKGHAQLKSVGRKTANTAECMMSIFNQG